MRIQLEPGFWKTSTGDKIEIIAIRANIAIGYYYGRVLGYTLDGKCTLAGFNIVSKWEEPKKIYKLSEMWKTYWKIEGDPDAIYATISENKKILSTMNESVSGRQIKVIAIVQANSTEFIEGEGLEN